MTTNGGESHLRKQGFADEAAGRDAGRNGPHAAALVHDVLRQPVAVVEPLLDRDELTARIALVGQEEQPARG